jgi:thioredoxin-like negative regulator of GroEL
MLDSQRMGRRQRAFDCGRRIAASPHPDLHAMAMAGRMLEIENAGSSDAQTLYRRMADLAPAHLYPRYRLCETLMAAGETSEASELAAALARQAPDNIRIADLEKRAALSASTPHPDRWRRWVTGPASLREGDRMARARMAVVVIGFRSQPSLVEAVRSLLEQDEPAEIVVVNTGGGDAASLLAPYSAQIRLIEIEEPRYAGAARNIGIDASMAPYVAFLEGDCRARPGWIRVRLAAHEKGARAVASAIVPSDFADDLALSAHLCLFGARSPQVPPNQALRYGTSYDRQIFAEFGYFNPTLRIGEDSDLARRLGKQVHPSWDPRVQTEHGSPASRLRFCVEMIGRGRRAARYQPANDRQSPWRLAIMREILSVADQRTRSALRVAADILKLDAARQRSIRKRIAPASLAYGIGTFLGLWSLHRARCGHQESRRSRAQGDIGKALRQAHMALLSDPANLAIRLELADLLRERGQAGDAAEAAALLDEAAWQSACHDERLVGLAGWLLERDMPDRACRLGEIATFTLPSASRIHDHLAQAAASLGNAGAGELSTFDWMARDPAALPPALQETGSETAD